GPLLRTVLMFRVLFFLFVILLLGLGLTWLADQPGDVVISFAGKRMETNLVAALAMAVAVVAVLLVAWWLLRTIFGGPSRLRRYFRVRRRDRGYQALSTGLIAAGAGDAGQARRMGRQAGKLLSADREPLIRLLDAQAAMLDGDHDTARARFEAMSADPETRLLGL